MAVTVAKLAVTLRITTGEAQPVPEGAALILGNLLAFSQLDTEHRAPSAPEVALDQAIYLQVAYLYDSPNAASGGGFGNSFYNSGASEVLRPWTIRRARRLDPDGSAGISAGTGTATGAGVDQTARANAARALELLQAPSDAEADAATAGTIRGWAAAKIRRVVESIVPAWARRGQPPTGTGGGTTLPTFDQADEEVLHSRGGNLYWDPVNEVPDTPGTSSGIGHVLTVTGENDRDRAWRAPTAVDVAAREAAASANREVSELQTGETALRRALTALEDALPENFPAPANAAKRYELHVPPSTAVATRPTWEEATAGSGGSSGGAGIDQTARDQVAAEATTRGAADTALGTRIDQEATARTAADGALGTRIDGLEAARPDPVIEPNYWVKSDEARTLLVHFSAVQLANTSTGQSVSTIQLMLQGITVSVGRDAGREVYGFSINARDAATINRAAGNAGQDTVEARVSIIDENGTEVDAWHLLLRVIANALVGGPTVDQVARNGVAAEQAARAAADTALGLRIDEEAQLRVGADQRINERLSLLALPVPEPVLDPNYWVKSSDARSVIVHLAASVLTVDVTRIRLELGGATRRVNKAANQEAYGFPFDATAAATITRNAGTQATDTISASVTLEDSGGNALQSWHFVVRVLDSAPAGGTATVDQVARNSVAAEQILRERADTAEATARANADSLIGTRIDTVTTVRRFTIGPLTYPVRGNQVTFEYPSGLNYTDFQNKLVQISAYSPSLSHSAVFVYGGRGSDTRINFVGVGSGDGTASGNFPNFLVGAPSDSFRLLLRDLPAASDWRVYISVLGG